MLANTPYRAEIETARAQGGGAASLDEALRHNLVADYRHILKFLNQEAYGYAMTLLGRYDVANIKTILRGKHMGLPDEEIVTNFIAAGRLAETELIELCRQPDVRAVVDVLATWGIAYTKPLMGEMPAYSDSGDLSHLELALDKYYFEDALARTKGRRANAKLARNLVQTQIDSVDLLTVLRMLKADLEPDEAERMYVPGGTYISKELFLALAPLSDIDELLDGLAVTPYKKVLEASLVLYLETASLSVLERALEQYLIKRATDLGHGDPLGLGIAMAYIWAKQNEMVNLRIIVRGKAVGMPDRRIREEIVFA